VSGQVDPARSRILLVGTPAYVDPRLPDVPVIERNIADLRSVFTDPDLGGFASEHCVAAPFGASVAEVGRLLSKAAKEAEDLLLFYYCGHGLVGKIDRSLYLSVRDTVPDEEGFSAMSFAAVRNAFLHSRAVRRVVILDSCFSGRAIGETLAENDAEILEQVAVDGSYTLTSAPSNQTALVRPGEDHTAFTERFLAILRTGLSGPAETITLGEIYLHLRERLLSASLPQPQQRGTGTADRIGLVRNRAWQPAGVSDTPSPAAAEAGAISQEQGQGQAAGQARYAGKPGAAVAAPASHGTQRALLVLEHAERIAGQISDPGEEAFILAAIAAELPSERRGTVLDRAAEAAHASTGTISEARAIAAVIAAGGKYPGGISAALQVATGAEPSRIMSVFRREQGADARQKADAARRAIAVVLARADRDKAEEVARLISSDWQLNRAFAGIALRLARVDAEAAIQAALKSGSGRDETLRFIASSLGWENPARAEELLANITDKAEHDKARHELAVAVAASNLPWAMQVARSVHNDGRRWLAIAAALGAFVQAAPQRADEAEQAVAEITEPSARAVALAVIGGAVVGHDREHAAALFSRAEKITMRPPVDDDASEDHAAAFFIQDEDENHGDDEKASLKSMAARVSALCAIAIAVAPTDPGQSKRLTDEAEKTARRMKSGKNSYRGSEEYTSALFSIGAAIAAVSIERGKKLIKKGWDKWDYPAPGPEKQLRATIRALIMPDPDRAESIARQLLSGKDKADALKEMAFHLAAADPDRAERIAGTIEDLVEQAATLIEIAVIQAGRRPSPIPWVDTKLPNVQKTLRLVKVRF
jgi:hypothetical protein